MVRFAVSSMFFHEYPLEEIFQYIDEACLDSVEFWLETPSFWLSGLPVDELVRCMNSYPQLSSPTLHAPILDLNPTSVNPDIAKISITYAIKAIQMASRIGIDLVTVHPGRRTAKRPPGAFDFERFSIYIEALKRSASGSGVRVAMENMEPKVNSLLCTPGDMRELLDREPWIWCTLDISHAMPAGAASVKRYVDLCGDRLINVHVGRAAGGKMHLPLGKDPEMAEILHYLAQSGYEGNLTLELEDRNFSHDLSSEEKILLLSTELEFMKECFAPSTDL